MKLELIRTYYLKVSNETRISRIPEGEYELRKRYSLRFAWRLQVMNVPGRTNILIHPANNAMLEPKGCIAHVSMLRCGKRTPVRGSASIVDIPGIWSS